MTTHRLIVVALLSIISICSGESAKKLNVDYQIHSNNNLNEFRQILLKGSRKFKFDPHYVSDHRNCGKLNECFLLNHDKPTSLVSDYNSSTELLNYLSSSEFKSLTNDEYVSVALCFKSAPDKCKTDSAAFQSWLKLVDDFHAQALNSVPSNVEFILDGDAKPSGCLVGKWQPWNSVWIIGDSSEAFTSNEQTNDYYRYQILNNPENKTNWQWMAQPDVNYGKFSNGSYPYQLWEPDRQEDIQEYKDIYLGGPQHAGGYHFAINSDIAMFRVYSSSVGKYVNSDKPVGINQLLDSTANPNFIGENPILVPLSASQFAVVYTSKSDHSSLFYVTMSVDDSEFVATSSVPVALPKTYSQWLAISDRSKLTRAALLRENLLLLVSDTGKSLAFSPTDHSISYSGSISVDSAAVMDTIIAPSNLCGGAYCVFVVSKSSASKNGLVLSTVSISLVAEGATLSAKVVSSLTVSTPSSTVGNARAVYATTSNSVLLFTSDAELQISGCEISLTAPVSNPNWVIITAGDSLDVSYSASSDVLMLVNDHGYCYNSHDHNTRSYPTVCAAKPVPTQYTMDYSLGLLADWLTVLRAPNSGDHAVTSCHQDILHGTYDQGANPVVAFTSSGSFFIELHEGIPTNSSVSVDVAFGGCGEPIHRDGVVVDSFAISEWISALMSSADLRKQSGSHL